MNFIQITLYQQLSTLVIFQLFVVFLVNYNCGTLSIINFTMDIEHRRYFALDLKIDPSNLKEVSPTRKQQLFQMGDESCPIIIDYGSQTIKAGYQYSQDTPEIVFRPYVTRNRDPNKTDVSIKQAINTSYDQLDLQKITYKGAFERNIILHFSILQQCNDYLFSQICRPLRQIRSPIIISQPFGNPIHCRISTLQQFFECYQIESVMIGVDSLFAYFYQLGCNFSRYQSQTSLVMDISASTVHIFAVVNGKVQWNSIRRINVGVSNAFELFSKSVILKHPQLKNKFNYPFLKDIFEKFTEVACDYKEQLAYFKQDFEPKKQSKYYKNRIHELNKQYQQNLPFISTVEIDFQTIIEIPEEELRRKEQIKKRMSEKLKETITRRKQMKKKMHQKELQDLQFIRDRYQQHDKEAHQQVAQIFGQHHAYDKLLKKIKNLKTKLGLIEQKPDEKKFSLIDIPDQDLPPEKLRFKKMQIYQKKAWESRVLLKQQKQMEEKEMNNLRQSNPEEYLAQLRQKYHALAKRVKQNQRIKAQLNNRKSRLKQKKMQALIKLVQDDGQDNFGQNDDDWLLYKDIQQSDHGSQLDAMQAQLRQIDPQWMQNKRDIHHLNSNNQVFLKTQLIRCHQIYFEPRLVGVNQSGLIDTIVNMLRIFNTQTQQSLLKNIRIIGGGSKIKGLKFRLERDLKRQCHQGLQINVQPSQAGWRGAFLGMKNIAMTHRQLLPSFSFMKHDYMQQYEKMDFVENPWSNPKPMI